MVSGYIKPDANHRIQTLEGPLRGHRYFTEEPPESSLGGDIGLHEQTPTSHSSAEARSLAMEFRSSTPGALGGGGAGGSVQPEWVRSAHACMCVYMFLPCVYVYVYMYIHVYEHNTYIYISLPSMILNSQA